MSAGVVVTIAVLCVLSWVGAGMYDFGIGGTPHDTNRDGVSKHALAHRKDWRNCRQPGYYKDLIPSLKYALFLPTDYRPTTH